MGSQAKSQEKASLKFSQAYRNVKSCLGQYIETSL